MVGCVVCGGYAFFIKKTARLPNFLLHSSQSELFNFEFCIKYKFTHSIGLFRYEHNLKV